MDLRVRLVAYLGGLLLVLLVVACGLLALDLRRDVEEEVRGSYRLAEVLLAASELGQAPLPAGGAARLAALTGGGALRHVAISVESADAAATSAAEPPRAGWWRMLLPEELASGAPHRIPVGDAVLVIRANPEAEIAEVLRDGGRILLALTLFSLATLAVAWLAAHRALAPARNLLDGLQRLEKGEREAALPAFELQEFSRIAAAINRLAASLEQARGHQRQLARQLLELQESERRELARELHDEFGQTLTAIGVTAAYVERHAGSARPEQLAECGREIGRAARGVGGHVRSMLSRLRPHGLEGLGLIAALGDLLESWRQRAPELDFQYALPESLPPLERTAALTLYRVLQEALTNVLRHSGASACCVEFGVGNGEVSLRVSDNGCGRAAALWARAGGGLLGMEERAAMAGGSVGIEDGQSGGISLWLRLPVKKGDKDDDRDFVA